MTREDAIYWIKNLAVLATEKDMLQIEEALNMAIEALADRKTEPQTDTDFTLTYTCSFSDCENFKHFGFGEKCIECKRKQSKAMRKTEPQTESLEQFRVGLEYHTDTAHFGKVKGESITTNKVKDEPQTDCSWK